MTKIAVSGMSNEYSFLNEGVYTAMRKLASRGVKYLEVSGHIQFDDTTIPEFEKAIRDSGVQIAAISASFAAGYKENIHTPKEINGGNFRSFDADEEFDRVVSLAHHFHCQNIRFAGFPCRSYTGVEDMKRSIALAEDLALRYKAEGLNFCAHNHKDEFIRMDGKLIYDWIAELAPDLMFECDVLHMQKCGLDPVSVINKLGSRAVLLHLQDLRVMPITPGSKIARGADVTQGVEVGEGNMNMQGIIDAAVAAGSQFIIAEQSEFWGRDPYDSIEISVKNMEKMLG